MTNRGDRSRRPFRRVLSGTHGYIEGSPDAEAAPAVVYPPRIAVVPSDSLTPLTAAGDGEIETGGPGGGSPIDIDNVVYLEGNNPSEEVVGGPSGNGNYTLWDTIYDRGQNDITMTGIPAAMGLTLNANGYVIDVDESGLWHFELMANPNNDDTAVVDMQLFVQGDYTGGPRQQLVTLKQSELVNNQPEMCMSALSSLVDGDLVAVASRVLADSPTAPDYEPWGYGILKITRLA